MPKHKWRRTRATIVEELERDFNGLNLKTSTNKNDKSTDNKDQRIDVTNQRQDVNDKRIDIYEPSISISCQKQEVNCERIDSKDQRIIQRQQEKQHSRPTEVEDKREHAKNQEKEVDQRTEVIDQRANVTDQRSDVIGQRRNVTDQRLHIIDQRPDVIDKNQTDGTDQRTQAIDQNINFTDQKPPVSPRKVTISNQVQVISAKPQIPRLQLFLRAREQNSLDDRNGHRARNNRATNSANTSASAGGTVASNQSFNQRDKYHTFGASRLPVSVASPPPPCSAPGPSPRRLCFVRQVDNDVIARQPELLFLLQDIDAQKRRQADNIHYNNDKQADTNNKSLENTNNKGILKSLPVRIVGSNRPWVQRAEASKARDAWLRTLGESGNPSAGQANGLRRIKSAVDRTPGRLLSPRAQSGKTQRPRRIQSAKVHPTQALKKLFRVQSASVPTPTTVLSPREHSQISQSQPRIDSSQEASLLHQPEEIHRLRRIQSAKGQRIGALSPPRTVIRVQSAKVRNAKPLLETADVANANPPPTTTSAKVAEDEQPAASSIVRRVLSAKGKQSLSVSPTQILGEPSAHVKPLSASPTRHHAPDAHVKSPLLLLTPKAVRRAPSVYVKAPVPPAAGVKKQSSLPISLRGQVARIKSTGKKVRKTSEPSRVHQEETTDVITPLRGLLRTPPRLFLVSGMAHKAGGLRAFSREDENNAYLYRAGDGHAGSGAPPRSARSVPGTRISVSRKYSASSDSNYGHQQVLGRDEGVRRKHSNRIALQACKEQDEGQLGNRVEGEAEASVYVNHNEHCIPSKPPLAPRRAEGKTNHSKQQNHQHQTRHRLSSRPSTAFSQTPSRPPPAPSAPRHRPKSAPQKLHLFRGQPPIQPLNHVRPDGAAADGDAGMATVRKVHDYNPKMEKVSLQMTDFRKPGSILRLNLSYASSSLAGDGARIISEDIKRSHQKKEKLISEGIKAIERRLENQMKAREQREIRLKEEEERKKREEIEKEQGRRYNSSRFFQTEKEIQLKHDEAHLTQFEKDARRRERIQKRNVILGQFGKKHDQVARSARVSKC